MIESWESGVKITGITQSLLLRSGQARILMASNWNSASSRRLKFSKSKAARPTSRSTLCPVRIIRVWRLILRCPNSLLPTAGFPNTDYMIINNNKEPFNNVEVRQAMSMAVDRERLSQILNGRAIPLAGFLPARRPRR